MSMREAEAARKRRGLTRLEVGNSVWLNKTESERREPIRVAMLLMGCYLAMALIFMSPAVFDSFMVLRHVKVFVFGTFAVVMMLQVVGPIQAVKELRRRPEAMLRYHVCACCGYDLRGVAAADDGCTVCPECGAAYDMSVRAAPLGRTLRPVWRLVPWFDDRWRRVRQWGRLDPNAPEAARTIQKQLGLGRRAKWWALLYVSVAAALAGAASRLPVGEPETAPVVVLFFAALLVCFLTTFLTNRALRRGCFCLACFESLAAVPADADRRRTCPICGAVWKMAAEASELEAAQS